MKLSEESVDASCVSRSTRGDVKRGLDQNASAVCWCRSLSRLLVFGLMGLLIGGCGPVTPSPEPTHTPLAGEISSAGSTTLQPLAIRLARCFGRRTRG